MLMNISELIQGDTVRLLSFGLTPQDYKRKLLSLGFTCGSEFRIIRRAPLGCPVQIEIKGTALTLRQNEAAHLVLERT